MNFDTAHLICYSPTRTTFTTVQQIATGMALPVTRNWDLTLPTGVPSDKTTIKGGITLIGVPVYAGRVAPMAAERLKSLKGNNTPAILVVVYGNRHYDGALAELKTLAEASGFVVVAGAALLGEHSFSTPEKPIAEGRPDENDKHAARQFGASVMAKLEQVTDLSTLAPIEFPGTLPEGPYTGPANIAPEVDPSHCRHCGECASHCPTAAITMERIVTIDASRCTVCCTCVKACPNGAIRFTVPKIQEITGVLHENCKTRREPELFL